MKKAEGKKQADYILLNHIIVRYLEKGLRDSTLAPRYLETETIDDIVEPFYEIKRLIQRVEWFKTEEYVDELLQFLVQNKMSVEELRWAVDMFTLQKQDVMNRIEARVCVNEL